MTTSTSSSMTDMHCDLPTRAVLAACTGPVVRPCNTSLLCNLGVEPVKRGTFNGRLPARAIAWPQGGHQAIHHEQPHRHRYRQHLCLRGPVHGRHQSKTRCRPHQSKTNTNCLSKSARKCSPTAIAQPVAQPCVISSMAMANRDTSGRNCTCTGWLVSPVSVAGSRSGKYARGNAQHFTARNARNKPYLLCQPERVTGKTHPDTGFTGHDRTVKSSRNHYRAYAEAGTGKVAHGA